MVGMASKTLHASPTLRVLTGVSLLLLSVAARQPVQAQCETQPGPTTCDVAACAGTARQQQRAPGEGMWAQLDSTIVGATVGAFAGQSVALSIDGSTLAVGSLDPVNPGSVRVYAFSGGAWDQLGSDIVGENAGDSFGLSLALNAAGNILAVGAPFNDAGGTNSGHVRVYTWSGVDWVRLGADLSGEAQFDFSGISVALSARGNRLVVGAFGNDADGPGTEYGHARVYEYQNAHWVLLGSDIDGEAPGDQSGYSVDISADGNKLAVGARFNNGDGGASSGHVRVFVWTGVGWEQLGDDMYGGGSGDTSTIFSLSDDGTTVAVGAHVNDGDSAGPNSGHARVYKFNGATWTQVGADLDGSAANDGFGSSVSLNSDGTVLAVGAPGAGAGGSVKVYKYDDAAWTQIANDIQGDAAIGRAGQVSLDGAGLKVGVGDPQANGFLGNARVFQTIPPSPPSVASGAGSDGTHIFARDVNTSIDTDGSLPTDMPSAKSRRIPSTGRAGAYSRM